MAEDFMAGEPQIGQDTNSTFFVHSQLIQIHQCLKSRYDDLVLLEEDIQRRESIVNEQVEVIEKIMALLNLRQEKLEDKERKLRDLEEEIRHSVKDELSCENHRLKASFVTLRKSHFATKSQLRDVSSKNDALVSQISSLQARMSSLKKSNESLQKTIQSKSTTVEVKPARVHNKLKNRPFQPAIVTSYVNTPMINDLELLLIHWLTKTQLYINKHHSSDEEITLSATSLAHKALPLISTNTDFISLPVNITHRLVVLEFIYMCISMVDKQSVVASSLRRIAEKCLAYVVKDSPVQNVNANMICILVVLQVINQVDKLNQVLEVLETNLRSDKKVQEMFYMYHGLPNILKLLNEDKPTILHNKILSILLILTSEFVFVTKLCGCVKTLISYIKQQPLTDQESLDKLSIILQRLSKHKITHSSFHSCNAALTLQDALVNRKCVVDNSFALLNIKSVLVYIKT